MRPKGKRRLNEKLPEHEIRVTCGIENAIFDTSLYGPGGSSRCIRFGEHVITPIELEALAGKKSVNWKMSIRVEGKPIKTLFEDGRLKNCDKSCLCDNCVTGKNNPSNLELLIEKVYKIAPKVVKVKIEKEDKDEKKKTTSHETKTQNTKEAESLKKKKSENSEPIKPDESGVKSKGSLIDKTVIGKDSVSDDGGAPLNDVKDEFCTSPDPSPRKKRSSIETPVDEILDKIEVEVKKEIPKTERNRRPSRKTTDTKTINSTPDFDLNKEVAPLVNMPSDKIIPDEMAHIKPDPDMVRKRQQADIRSFFSPPAKEAQMAKTEYTPSTLTLELSPSPAKSDCSVEVVIEAEPIKKILEVDLTESPSKSRKNSDSGDHTEDTDTKSMQSPLEKKSPPSITKESLVRHTRGMRLQDRAEIVKEKHKRQREESVGREKKSIELNHNDKSSQKILNASTNKQEEGKTKESREVNGDRSLGIDRPSKRKTKEDEKLLRLLKEEKSLALSPRSRVLKEANKVNREKGTSSVNDGKSIKPLRRTKRRLSENEITAELEKKSPSTENAKIPQEPAAKRQKQNIKEKDSETNTLQTVSDVLTSTPPSRQSSNPEKENSDLRADDKTSKLETLKKVSRNVKEMTEPIIKSDDNRKKENSNIIDSSKRESKEVIPTVTSNDLSKVSLTEKSGKGKQVNLENTSAIPKPTFINDKGTDGENSEIPGMNMGQKKESENVLVNGTNEVDLKTESNENKVSPNKLPTYTTMIKSALEEMNVIGGEGCSKLEILLYILRKFRPKGNINAITTKLIKVLEVGTKRGDFLSSISCPRVLKKVPEVKKDTGEIEKKKEKPEKAKEKEKIKVKKIKTKDGKVVKVKVNNKGSKQQGVKKEKLDKNKEGKEKTKRTVSQLPQKLKEPLATICKAKKLTRHEVLKKIWAYIRTKKLQDPNNKKIINCDDNLRKMTKVKQIQQASLMGYLKPFMDKMK